MVSIYTERYYQRCDNAASNTTLIENNGVPPEWGCHTIWSDPIVFHERSIPSVIAALMLTLRVNCPLEGKV